MSYLAFVDKEDASKQSLGALHESRKRVIRLYKKGHEVMQIVELTGLSWPNVRTAFALYEAGGATALKPNARGKQEGEVAPPHAVAGGRGQQADLRQAARAAEDGLHTVGARRR